MKPRYNEVLGITNDFLYPSRIVKYMEKNLVMADKFCQSLGPSLCRGSTACSTSTPVTCDQAVLFLFCLGDEGDKNASSQVTSPVELEFGNVGFWGEKKTAVPGEKTQSMWRQRLILGHIGERRLLSPPPQACPPATPPPPRQRKLYFINRGQFVKKK